MKFQKQEVTFQPITITIESVEELKFLWHRLQGGWSEIDFCCSFEETEIGLKRDKDTGYEWWNQVDEALIALGEKG